MLAASCGSCRVLTGELGDERLDEPMIVLVPGRPELADAIVAMLPAGVEAVRDPEASEVVDALGLQTTPFAFRVVDGRVAGKSYLHGIYDLVALLESHPARAHLSHGRLTHA